MPLECSHAAADARTALTVRRSAGTALRTIRWSGITAAAANVGGEPVVKPRLVSQPGRHRPGGRFIEFHADNALNAMAYWSARYKSAGSCALGDSGSPQIEGQECRRRSPRQVELALLSAAQEAFPLVLGEGEHRTRAVVLGVADADAPLVERDLDTTVVVAVSRLEPS